MKLQVLGVSGSPVPESNTDWAVKRILQSTGLTNESIKLSDLKIEPCRGCLGCVKSNRCVTRDDARFLAELFHEAAAVVLGAFTPYNSLDARTKTFMERMYCFRHRAGGKVGKVGAAVITTAYPTDVPGLPAGAETAASQIAFWMVEEGITNLGTLVLQGNVPLIRCGRSDDCLVSGIKVLHGLEATAASVGVSRFEYTPSLTAVAEQLGENIRQAVLRSAVTRK